jgi:hypothetical protein
LALLFYWLILIIGLYQSYLYFFKPIQIELNNNFLYFDFPIGSCSYHLGEIIGYSRTSYQARGKIYQIVLLYTSGNNVFEFWDNWYQLNELETLFLSNNLKFLGYEKYRFKIVWLFVRKYKYKNYVNF